MRKLVVVVVTVFLSGIMAFAQTRKNAVQQRGSIEQAMDEQQDSSMSGCLRASGGNYWLSTSNGRRFRLNGDTGDLARLAGHRVRIAGTRSNTKRTLTVNNATDLSRICTATSRTAATHNGKARNTGQHAGIAAPSSPANSSYEEHPAQPVPDASVPNPPLNHPRPEDETPSVGTSTKGAANASGTATEPSSARRTSHKKQIRRHHQNGTKAQSSGTNTPQTTTPPPRF